MIRAEQGDALSFCSAAARFFRRSRSATQSGASSVGPSEHVGGKRAACLSLKVRRGAEALTGHRISRPSGAVISCAVSEFVPGTRSLTWDRTPLGLKTTAPYQPRAALAGDGSERRWNSENRGSGVAREAERDTTGSINRQLPVHTWIGGPAQGRRRHAATVPVILD